MIGRRKRFQSRIPYATSLLQRNGAAELVEEIEDEGDLVYCSGLFCGRGFEHGEAFAVRVQVEGVLVQIACVTDFPKFIKCGNPHKHWGDYKAMMAIKCLKDLFAPEP